RAQTVLRRAAPALRRTVPTPRRAAPVLRRAAPALPQATPLATATSDRAPARRCVAHFLHGSAFCVKASGQSGITLLRKEAGMTERETLQYLMAGRVADFGAAR